MSRARREFLGRLAAFGQTIVSEPLSVKPPIEQAHNDSARLLRNGIAVVAFAALEDFIRRRTVEALRSLSVPLLRFSDLPERLRRASTVDAIASLTFQARLRNARGEDPVAYIQSVAGDVASTVTASFVLPELALGFSGSNLSVDDVSRILKSFNVDHPWDQIGQIAKRVGLGAPPSYKDAYISAVRLRNAAAHDGAFDAPLADLLTLERNALAIGIGFDALLSRAARLFRTADRAFLSAGPGALASRISMRYVDRLATGHWREWREGATRAVKRDRDDVRLFSQAIQRATPRWDVVVKRSGSAIPLDWHTTDL